MKNRFTKRSVSAALILSILVILLLPVSVSAGGGQVDTEYKTLRAGQWADKSEKTYKRNGETRVRHTWYKISLSKPGRLKFTLSKTGEITICNRAFILGNEEDESWVETDYDSDRKMFAVDKGTYYVSVTEGKCKYTFTAETTPKNYCQAKAKALRANTTAWSVFTPKTNFDRWYKITISGRKKITFSADTADHAYSMTVFDKNHRMLETAAVGSGTKYRTKTAQNRGTYYIRVSCYLCDWQKTYDYAFGEVTSFKWN